jgi:hypothetical protein
VRRSRIESLVKRHIAPSFPELTLVRDLLVRWDGDPIVRGFAFARSRTHASMVRMEVFAQPLFVPANVVGGSLTQELGQFLFDEVASEIELLEGMRALAEHEGQAFLRRVSDCSALAQTVPSMAAARMDDRLGDEIRAYCMVWLGRTAEARAVLDVLIHELRAFELESEFELLSRVRHVKQTLERSDDEARELLAKWAQGTARALRLGR